jgi:hypothetical protein
MKNKMLKVIFAIFLLAAMSPVTFASYPSYDTETDCRNCHGITADQHHLLVANGTKQCTDCHAMKYDTQNKTYYPEVIRNCLACHGGKDHTDAHHLLVQQGLFACMDCHEMKYDVQNQTYYPEITWDCTACHSTILNRDSAPVPAPVPAPVNPPTITQYSPASPQKDVVGASRKFNVTIDQKVNLTWYINGNPVQSNDSVTDASYINSSAVLGVWNVSVKASNVNGNIMYTWIWNVTSVPTPPVITSSAPISTVNDTFGSSRKFGITIDQTANIVWYINGNPVQSNDSVIGASYNNASTTAGVWNVDAIATNANGSVMHSWTWNVIIDHVSPEITINSPVNGRIYLLYQSLIAKWSVNDIDSRIAMATGTYPSGSTIKTNSVGTKNFSVYAKDNAGNTNIKNVTYYIRYNFGGFLWPIKTDGSSIFKKPNEVSIKFQLKDANGNYVNNAIAKLSLSIIGPTIGEKYLQSSTTATNGGVFKYNSKDKIYYYNLETKGLASGTWQIRVNINDGSSNAVNIFLQK